MTEGDMDLGTTTPTNWLHELNSRKAGKVMRQQG